MWSFSPAPVALALGPVAIRWYGLAYIAGFILSYIAMRRSALREHADDLLLAIMLGTILGGRIGEFVFYSPSTVWTNPLEILQIWHGGMSFHGGLIGVFLAVLWYCSRNNLKLLRVADVLVLPAAIGLFFGRLANFMNGELYGTVTNVPWCVLIDGVPGCRHPSPLYEAAYSALIAAVLLAIMWYRSKPHQNSARAGVLLSTFLIVYGVCRTIVNYWRDDPRPFILSNGQWLSILTAFVGIVLLWAILKNSKPEKEVHESQTSVHRELQRVRRSAGSKRRRART